MDKQIRYTAGGKELLDDIGPLWEKLNALHLKSSPQFKHTFEGRPFSQRKRELLDPVCFDMLFVITAKEDDRTVGYIVFGILGLKGKIESICVEENHRGCGIGRRLMDKALSQLHEYNLKNITLSVVIGNENVLPFYEKFGFYPRLTELWLKSTDTSKTI